METSQVSINRWMDKQNVVYTYDGIFFSLIKEGNFDTYYNMDEPWGHYAQWNKPVTKGQVGRIPLTWDTQSSQIHRDRK